MPPPLTVLARLRAQQGTFLTLSLSLFCDGFMSFVACLEPSTIQVIDLCKWFFFFFFFKSGDLLPFWNFVSHYEIVNGVIMRIGVF